MRRVIRYIKLYGFQRTITKVLGRLRLKLPLWLILFFPYYRRKGKKVAIIGCGHQAYSSISFYLSINTNSKIIGVYDINKSAAESLAVAYKSKYVSLDDLLSKKELKPDLVYICTNHATHANLALKFLEIGCDIFIEKPICVNKTELEELSKSVKSNNSQNVFAGYNRPLSPAIRKIKENKTNLGNSFTLSSFVIGHHIEEDHWYRNSEEGTRIISNLSHWIDLFVNMIFWNKWNKEYIDITISYSFSGEYSNNFNEPFTINLNSSNGDFSSITFSCREEPYEGVNETINFQQGSYIAKIDDFRTMSVWDNQKFKRYKFWPKNNGHKKCINQPFETIQRSWEELSISSELILFIDDMVKNHHTSKKFKPDNL